MAAIATWLSDEIMCCINKHIEDDHWGLIRKTPYFEGWLHVELCAHFMQSGGWEVKGFDIPARAGNKGIEIKNIYPDLLLYHKDSAILVWLELKVANLSRFLINPPNAASRYRGAVVEACGSQSRLKVKQTFDMWEIWAARKKYPQQMVNMCQDDKSGEFVSGLIDLGRERARSHIRALSVLVTSNRRQDVRSLYSQVNELDCVSQKPGTIVLRPLAHGIEKWKDCLILVVVSPSKH